MSVDVFISYADQDRDLLDQLESHLATLKRNGLIRTWHNHRITPGDKWAGAIDHYLERASLILILVSADLIASDYYWDVEIRRAIERHESGDARIIPIVLRPSDWKNTLFGEFQVLPSDGKPVTLWDDQDAALLDIADSLRGALKEVANLQSAETGSIRPSLSPPKRNRANLTRAARVKRSAFLAGAAVTFLLLGIFFVTPSLWQNPEKITDEQERWQRNKSIICSDTELLEAIRIIDSACDSHGACDYSKLEELDTRIHKYHLLRALRNPFLQTIHIFYPDKTSRLTDAYDWRSTKRYQLASLTPMGLPEDTLVFALARAGDEGDTDYVRALSADRARNILNYITEVIQMKARDFRVAWLGNDILQLERVDADILGIRFNEYLEDESALSRSAHVFVYPCGDLLH